MFRIKNFKKFKRYKSTTTTTIKGRWGLFSDIHFQDEGLERIEETGNWIIETFKKNKVSHIICLGDVLNTREMVSVQALSSSMNFFHKLSNICEVSVILGNHDMNLKLSGRISSLDGLNLNSNIKLYKEMKEIKIENIPGKIDFEKWIKI